MKSLKQQVLDRELSIENDGTNEELNNVLKWIFPKDKTKSSGNFRFYFIANKELNTWFPDDSTKLPSKSVKDFILEMKSENSDKQINPLYVEGQFITDGFPKRMLVWNGNKSNGKEFIVLAKTNDKSAKFIVVSQCSEKDYLSGSSYRWTSFCYAEELPTNEETNKAIEELEQKINEITKQIQELKKQHNG